MLRAIPVSRPSSISRSTRALSSSNARENVALLIERTGGTPVRRVPEAVPGRAGRTHVRAVVRSTGCSPRCSRRRARSSRKIQTSWPFRAGRAARTRTAAFRPPASPLRRCSCWACFSLGADAAAGRDSTCGGEDVGIAVAEPRGVRDFDRAAASGISIPRRFHGADAGDARAAAAFLDDDAGGAE